MATDRRLRERDVEAVIRFMAAEPTRIGRAMTLHRRSRTGYCTTCRRLPWPCLTRRWAEEARRRLDLIPRPREPQ